jgi:hypothetical protein
MKSNSLKSSIANEKQRVNPSRGSLAWFGRQTHNLENKWGRKSAQVSRGRGLESRPRHQTETCGVHASIVESNCFRLFSLEFARV